MKKINYFFEVIINIIIVYVVYNVFSVAYTPFDTVILAILILIYLIIWGYVDIWGQKQRLLFKTLYYLYQEIKKLINKGVTSEDDKNIYEKQLEKQWVKEEKEETVHAYIMAVSQCVLYIIVFYHLYTALY